LANANEKSDLIYDIALHATRIFNDIVNKLIELKESHDDNFGLILPDEWDIKIYKKNDNLTTRYTILYSLLEELDKTEYDLEELMEKLQDIISKSFPGIIKKLI